MVTKKPQAKKQPSAAWPFPATKRPGADRPLSQTVQHSVTATLVNVELPKAMHALKLELFAKPGKTGKLGELEIGQGSLYWKGRGKKTLERIDWTRFAEMMDELAYGE